MRGLLATLAGFALSTAGLAAPTPQRTSIAAQDSFRVGTSGVLCTAQARPLDKRLKGMFDRAYAIVCRDAAAPVGSLYALRDPDADPSPSVLAAEPGPLDCRPQQSVTIEGLGPVGATECTRPADSLAYRAFAVRQGRTWYVAEGLGGYESALRLGLRTLVADRPVTGEVAVAVTAAGNPAAFARVQAGSLDPALALNQAYGRNNAGSFAEAAEFFQTLVERQEDGDDAARRSEYLANQALQQSNLGAFNGADALFAQALAINPSSDPVAARLLRNYRAMHALNQGLAQEAIARLDVPVPPIDRVGGDDGISGGLISPTLAEQINRQNQSLDRLSGVDSKLRPFERAQLLDGQAAQLRGIALRLKGQFPEAIRALEQANALFLSVRDGRVASTAFLRSEGFAELALISEAKADYGAAERQFGEAASILQTDYPQSPASLAAKARLAAFLARHGSAERALTLYGDVVAESLKLPGAAGTMQSLLAPYFALLVPRAASDPKAAEALFAANQVMVRPGVAQTQAVFARELSGGDGEASALFRESVSVARDVARSTQEVSRLAADRVIGRATEPQLAAARDELALLEQRQTALQSRLGAFPRYRVLAPEATTVAELRHTLRPHEAYYQLRIIGPDVYAMIVTPDAVRAAKIATTADALASDAIRLRASVVTTENGQTVTRPFDLELARKLYLELFGPFETEVAAARSLVFEPDGPMLALPPNLLVADQAGVDAYLARQKIADADPFDYRGVAWLGRGRDITTSVSPRSFVDVRGEPASRGTRPYLGLGHNAPLTPQQAFRRISTAGPGSDCDWPSSAWNNPISATELTLADRVIGQGQGALITDQAFSDTALMERRDLSDFRILHFATHGLVSAPHAGCQARPALLTSFGTGSSDGLLTFREIFDLKLDADLVLLSACDTAGAATETATREAGITTGGNFELDGLVRAFVGAGARTVVASHWPIPDDYDATKRLISALFAAAPGTSVAAALGSGQRELMDAAATSHPFYWAAFAIVGDGEKPVRSQ